MSRIQIRKHSHTLKDGVEINGWYRTGISRSPRMYMVSIRAHKYYLQAGRSIVFRVDPTLIDVQSRNHVHFRLCNRAFPLFFLLVAGQPCASVPCSQRLSLCRDISAPIALEYPLLSAIRMALLKYSSPNAPTKAPTQPSKLPKNASFLS